MTDERGSAGDGFRKKRFTVRSFLSGTARFAHNLPRLVRASRGDRVDAQFAEKIMLAVTAVNECRYCTRYHTDLARETGVDGATIDRLLESDIDAAVGEAERPALVFAQRYAATDESPDPEAVAELRAAYEPETARDIRAFARAIYYENLLGNSVDAVRFAAGRRLRRARHRLRRGVAGAERALERVRDRCPV
jgi:AhpD family alkylhydroperoxidase